MIFVNFSSDDLARSRTFYEALGCEINPMFTDDNAVCVQWDEQSFFMILSRDFFARFTGDKRIIDAHTEVQALVGLTRDSRAEVDNVVAAALAAGGKIHREPEDYGFMYQHAIQDPDGNVLEFFYMDPEAAAQGPDNYLADHVAAEVPEPI